MDKPRIKRLIFSGVFVFFMAYPVFSQSSFSKGEAIFLENRPQEALQYLETAAAEDPAHVQAYIYLGITYQQLNRPDDAINALQKILPRGGSQTAVIAFNLGNAWFSKGNYSMAVQYYTSAMDADPSFYSAILNRANSKIKMNELKDAVADYQMYLRMEPFTPQRGQIEKLIAFINEEFAAEERRIEQQKIAEQQRLEELRLAEERRLEELRIAEERRVEELRIAEEKRLEDLRIAEEQRRIADEQRRIAEEQRRIAEEELARVERERRQRLLDEVAASLQAAAEDSRGLSAGNEGVQGYEGEFELE